MYLRYFLQRLVVTIVKLSVYQHRGSASRLVEDASRVLEDAYRVSEDVFRVLEDVFRLNVSASHQLVSAVFVVVSAYRARVFAFFISCFEKLGSQCAFAQVTRINTVAVGCNDKALGL